MRKMSGFNSLKLHRILSGLRQYQVAAKMGYSPASYCRQEFGTLPVNAKDAVRLSRILKVPVEILFNQDRDL